jgi:membrane protein DedA with SNARE-associated domain
VSSLIDHLLHVPPVLAYVVIAVLVFAEAAVFVGFVLPGETACVIGGVLAATGRLELALLLPLVVGAAIVGDSVGYEVGRLYGPPLLRTRLLRRHAYRLEGAQLTLRERGGWAVFVARFTAFLRAVMPGLAGMSRMPYARFLAFNAAGGLFWAVGVTLLGYFAGASYQRLEHALGQISAALFVVVIGGALLVWWRRRRRSNTGGAARSGRSTPPGASVS